MSNIDSILKNTYGFENPFTPDPLAEKSLPYLSNAKYLLDVGCGEGADTVFFAKKGFHVTALDNNETHLGRLQAFINDNSITKASVVNTNVLDFHYPQNYYDVISCLLVGCCMSRSDFEKLLVTLKLTVKKGRCYHYVITKLSRSSI
jgi:2-polyprenyl-3-methyl-5-hydroxy-6-metoxy-1,4-benzoquinol methylase